MSARFPVLLLDLDGTLSDNYAGIAGSIRHALSRLGAPDPGDDVLRSCVGPPLRETFARLVAGADASVVERAIDAYRERYAVEGWRENVPYPGIAEALAALHASQTRLFVCTSKPQRFAERIVAHFGFDAWVESVHGPDLAGRLDDKRDLMAHLLASERIDAKDCAMVGDRHHDIRAARLNGVSAIGVLWGYGSAAELSDADRVLREPRELLSLGRAGA